LKVACEHRALGGAGREKEESEGKPSTHERALSNTHTDVGVPH
jgi:hypothetical protein